MSGKKTEKVKATLAKGDREAFEEYASLSRTDRAAARAASFELPDMSANLSLEARLDAYREVATAQVALIDYLKRRNTELVVALQSCARACLEAASPEYPDVTDEMSVRMIAQVILELDAQNTPTEH